MKLNVNGADVEVDDRFAASPLLWVLGDVLGMGGTKYGCGIGYRQGGQTLAAAAAGSDPVEFRRALLADNPRTLRALELAADRAGWGSPLPQGCARGVDCSSFLSHSAQVTEISLDDRGRIHIDRIETTEE